MARSSSRTARTYRSRIDGWILGVMALSMGLAVLGIVIGGAQEGPLRMAQAGFILLGIGGFVAWIVLGTNYTLEGDRLAIRSGPLRWNILLADITSIDRSKGFARLKSGPALSMDRLTISYRNGKQLNISPAEPEKFLADLKARQKTSAQ